MTEEAPRKTPNPPLEPLALASFLSALVLGWCPLAGIAAIGLGATALHRIRAAGGRTGGKQLAIAGIALATAIMLFESWMLGRIQDEVVADMERQVVAAVEAAMTPLPAEAVSWDESAGAPSAEDAARFARDVAGRIGAVRSVSVTQRSIEGFAQPVVTAAFNAVGERGNAFGKATFATVPGTLPPRIVCRSVEVEAGGTRWRLPAEEAK